MLIEVIVVCVFVAACAYFSYSSGFNQGVVEGADQTLVVLEANNYIRTIKDKHGEVHIQRVPDSHATDEL